MSVLTQRAVIADIRRFKELIKDNWSLCNFYGNCESEVMIAQTIHAAETNFNTHGETFSYRGDGVFGYHGGGLVNNHKAYHRLIEDGMFVEEKRDDKVLIFPTQALINRLDEYFARKA